MGVAPKDLTVIGNWSIVYFYNNSKTIKQVQSYSLEIEYYHFWVNFTLLETCFAPDTFKNVWRKFYKYHVDKLSLEGRGKLEAMFKSALL